MGRREAGAGRGPLLMIQWTSGVGRGSSGQCSMWRSPGVGWPYNRADGEGEQDEVTEGGLRFKVESKNGRK